MKKTTRFQIISEGIISHGFKITFFDLPQIPELYIASSFYNNALDKSKSYCQNVKFIKIIKFWRYVIINARKVFQYLHMQSKSKQNIISKK